jgi:hypothetical protein
MAAERQSPRHADDALYTLPDTYACLSELSSPGPDENPLEGGRYGHSTLEGARWRERDQRAREGAEQDQDQEVGCLCKVVAGWLKRAMRRKRGS